MKNFIIIIDSFNDNSIFKSTDLVFDNYITVTTELLKYRSKTDHVS